MPRRERSGSSEHATEYDSVICNAYNRSNQENPESLMMLLLNTDCQIETSRMNFLAL